MIGMNYSKGSFISVYSVIVAHEKCISDPTKYQYSIINVHLSV